MSGFSAAWLRLRASFDSAARDAALAQRFAAVLPRPGRALALIDLGAGTGANARYLAPLIGGDQDWLLIDGDQRLLDGSPAEHIAWAAREGHGVLKESDGVVICAGAARWRFRTRRLDLARDLPAALGVAQDGIAMAALADLASAVWIDALAAHVERRRVPLLSALVVDGRRFWHPEAPEDGVVRAAFAEHQRRDKGLGPALGPAAPVYVGARLAAAGCAVATAPSDWRIAPEHREMLAAVIAGESTAALEAAPERRDLIAGWRKRREAELAAGSLALTIGHRDILAVPRG
jgi:hypothetical protein